MCLFTCMMYHKTYQLLMIVGINHQKCNSQQGQMVAIFSKIFQNWFIFVNDIKMIHGKNFVHGLWIEWD